MDYMDDDFLNTFDNEFDDDDFDDFEGEQDFYTFDNPFYPDLAQRDRDHRDRHRHDHFRPIGTRPRVRCCVYRNRNTGRTRKICQDRSRRCANRLGRNWVLVSSFTTNNCNRCI